MFCCVLLCVFIVLQRDREENAGCFTLSSWCLVIVIGLCLFLALPWVGLHCVIVVFPIIVTSFFSLNETCKIISLTIF